MNKVNFKISYIIVILALVFFTSLEVYASSNSLTIKRLWGLNRYATSVKVALEGWQQSDNAILANGENFPDALCAAPLAKKYNAPILLTQNDSLPVETIDAIKQLKVKNIFIIGGVGVISSNIENELAAMSISVTRVFGQDRYETDVKVAELLDNVSEIAIVTGEDYADALSIAPIAVKKNMPVILIEHNAIPDVVKKYISSHNINKAYVVGVGSSIDASALVWLNNVEQINGQDKYQRNLSIIDMFKEDLSLENLYVATGENFADALSGSVLAGLNSNPMLLLGNNLESQEDFFTRNSAYISSINILGGTGAVSDDDIRNLTTPTNTTVLFKDKQLEQVIRDTTHKPSGDLLISDVRSITKLDAEGRCIHDISGIEKLTNLNTLLLGNRYNETTAKGEFNYITDISALQNLRNLTNLDLSGNQISDVNPLKNLTSLEKLDLSTNKVSNLNDIKGLTNLTSLDLFGDPITDISSLRSLLNLTNLNLGKTHISEISALNGLVNLTNLDLQGNEISDISALKDLVNLINLEIKENDINDISALKNLTNLTTLDLANNHVSDISAMKSLSKLTTLDFFIYGNGSSDLSALRSLTNLNTLYITAFE